VVLAKVKAGAGVDLTDSQANMSVADFETGVVSEIEFFKGKQSTTSAQMKGHRSIYQILNLSSPAQTP
jgi:hypothetical protein